MPSDSSRPHCSGIGDVHLSRYNPARKDKTKTVLGDKDA